MRPAEFKEWRKRLGLTQDKAAELIGTSRVTIGNWESGDTPIWVSIERVCRDVEREWELRPAYGPVWLSCIDPPGPNPRIRPRYLEKFDSNNDAFRWLVENWSQLTYREECWIEVDGRPIWFGRRLREEVERRRADAIGPADGMKRSPEEAAAMRRDMDEFVRRFREEHAGETFLTDDEMYDEYGLPK
jgi:DNA-binding XRE family transcriptional regulator